VQLCTGILVRQTGAELGICLHSSSLCLHILCFTLQRILRTGMFALPKTGMLSHSAGDTHRGLSGSLSPMANLHHLISRCHGRDTVTKPILVFFLALSQSCVPMVVDAVQNQEIDQPCCSQPCPILLKYESIHHQSGYTPRYIQSEREINLNSGIGRRNGAPNGNYHSW